MKGARSIFRFLVEAMERGERTALVTLTEVIGSSSRAPGTHMGVSETGAAVGSFSGGCVEAAVISEAQHIIASGRAELVRFGAGSRYIDIRLPCGGGIDLLFTPMTDAGPLIGAIDLLKERRSTALQVGMDGHLALRNGLTPGWTGDSFAVRLQPDLRVIIVGHGAEPLALARQALAFGAEAVVLSPEDMLLAQAALVGAQTHRLLTPGRSAILNADPHTAIVFLFHDHDWEPDLLSQALETEAFFVGAMGSRITHARRAESLAARGVASADIARIAGPIGLIPAARDPDTLALSVMAELVAKHGDAIRSETVAATPAAGAT